jgi:putative flippase GtrA
LRHRVWEFIRFLVVGGSAAVSSWLLLFLCVEFVGLGYLSAFVVTFVLVNTSAFYLNGRFAFRGQGESGHTALLRFYALSGASLVVNTLAMKGLVGILGWPYLLAAVFLSAVNAPVNYLLHRRLTYRLRAGL